MKGEITHDCDHWMDPVVGCIICSGSLDDLHTQLHQLSFGKDHRTVFIFSPHIEGEVDTRPTHTVVFHALGYSPKEVRP